MKYEEIRQMLEAEFLKAKRLKLDETTSETFQLMTYQTIQEVERRRIDCQKQADSLRAQAAAAEHQAAAFSVVGSIMVNIVHGFIANEERALDEENRRRKVREDELREEFEEKAKLESARIENSENVDPIMASDGKLVENSTTSVIESAPKKSKSKK